MTELRRRHMRGGVHVSTYVELSDIDFDDEDVMDFVRERNLVTPTTVSDVTAFIFSHVWNQSEWAELQDALRQAFVLGQRRAA